MLEKFKRIKLGHFPTPIEHLKNISKHLDGPNIFIKRIVMLKKFERINLL